MRKVSSGPLLSIDTFYSIQWFWQRTAKTLIRLRMRAFWSGPSLSAHALGTFSLGAARIICSFFLSWKCLTFQVKTPRSDLDLDAGLGGSVGCAVRLETRKSRVQPPPRSATFFRRDWSWNIFYGHSLPSADSRRAVVSFWRKNVHNTG